MAENLPMPTLALITANAQTLRLFRTHLVAALVARGVRVLALAPNFDDDSRALVRSLGAEPVDCRLQRTGLNPVRDVLDTLHLARLLRRLRPDVVSEPNQREANQAVAPAVEAGLFLVPRVIE